ncbi:uncharacterized protein FPRO_12634 [Fusarium proliferatum ET1]|uniref:protein-ribulosamine 3-kinase n=1 Tax=Fusarium proliferatum (strain ET1) TaxID=1227346 RepID=A0A1L7W5Y1_FUSPR|nr:uncharacterized protein FPRO_12634 [Fusarium proliferatum ET1]CZR48024.1 uncharacterized protein FPRO_12634 [Fusarium proliferatum ET1]
MEGLNEIPKPTHRQIGLPVVIDDAVAEHFPTGSSVKDARSHGASFWTRTARIDVDLADKSIQRYFLKESTGELGMSMMRGECEGAKVIFKYTPEGIPRPIAWGTYKSDPNTHFYLCEFMDMIEELPDIRKFSSMLAKLHHESMVDEDAPKEFGFHVMTHEGSMYQDISWTPTWEQMYTRRFKSFADQERASQGTSEELDQIVHEFMEKIIPRLLRPLATNGRSIKPVALHADIWYGNIATNADTGGPVYFDPSVFWGHNECKSCVSRNRSRADQFYPVDVGNMATPRYRLGRHWMREYHKFFPISAPEEDYEDRNLLYRISGHFCASTLYPDNSFRKMAIEDMKTLLAKYPNGYQGE